MTLVVFFYLPRGPKGVHVGPTTAPEHTPLPTLSPSVLVVGVPKWFGPAVQAAVALAVGPAVQAALAPLQISLAKSHNTAVVGIAGKPLMAPGNYMGMQPAAGLFPATTDQLIVWEQTPRRDLPLWTRLHLLLQHYAVLDPATGAVFVAAAPAPLPAHPPGAAGVTELRHRVRAFRAFIML